MGAGGLRNLPTAAHADLRQLFFHLELSFGAPPVSLTGLLQPVDWVRPASPGGFPDRHVDNDDGDTILRHSRALGLSRAASATLLRSYPPSCGLGGMRSLPPYKIGGGDGGNTSRGPRLASSWLPPLRGAGLRAR
eukprot:914669-Pyramimonas_sp.AAC.1